MGSYRYWLSYDARIDKEKHGYDLYMLIVSNDIWAISQHNIALICNTIVGSTSLAPVKDSKQR